MILTICANLPFLNLNSRAIIEVINMGKRLKIFYIDDEADTEKFKSKFEIMQDNFIDVIYVTTVEEVFLRLKEVKKEIDLIILDIIIPPEDYYLLEDTNGGTTTGLKILEDIRKEENAIPIMIVSIKRKQMKDEMLRKYNVVKYLEKPLAAIELIKAIREIFPE